MENFKVSLKDGYLSKEITYFLHKKDKSLYCSIYTGETSRAKYVTIYNINLHTSYTIKTGRVSLKFSDVWPEIELRLTFGVC